MGAEGLQGLHCIGKQKQKGRTAQFAGLAHQGVLS